MNWKHFIRKKKIYLKSLYGRTDDKRWGNLANHYSNWDERTRIMSEYIKKEETIIEFGAGRLLLKSFIDASCVYQSSDIVSREENTIVCDLNATDLPVFINYDVAFFSGVIEYIIDTDRVLSHLGPKINRFIISYATTDKLPDMEWRRNQGWLSHFSKEKLINLFGFHDFVLSETNTWTTQDIFVFHKIKSE